MEENILNYMATTRTKKPRGRRRKPWLLCPQKQKLRSRKARPQTQHPRSGLSCRFWDLSCRRPLQSDTLMNKQPALPADPAAVSGETPISTDDAVARNHNGNRVRAVGQANSTDRFRAPQLTRQRPITHRRSGSDRPERRPNLALKGRASGRHGNGVDREEIA